MFYELRRYQIQPGQRDEWIRIMEETIVPFQVSRGMVFIGSFEDESDPDGYYWIRRFESEEERVELYKAVYESDTWKNQILVHHGHLLIREQTVVKRLRPTAKSPMR